MFSSTYDERHLCITYYQQHLSQTFYHCIRVATFTYEMFMFNSYSATPDICAVTLIRPYKAKTDISRATLCILVMKLSAVFWLKDFSLNNYCMSKSRMQTGGDLQNYDETSTVSQYELQPGGAYVNY